MIKPTNPTKHSYFEVNKHSEDPLYHVKVTMPMTQRIKNCVKAKLLLIPTGYELISQKFVFVVFKKKEHVAQLSKDNDYPVDKLPWNKEASSQESEGLYLFLHGLGQTPYTWKSYVKTVQKDHPGFHCVAPLIKNRGNCSLSDAADPILELVKDYIEKHPGKPIHIVGTSNGGRIAQYIEARLPEFMPENSSLAVATVAGLHYGTKFVSVANKYHLHHFLFVNKSVKKEFPYASDTAKREYQNWNDSQCKFKEKNIQVKHLFCATINDDLIKSQDSCLPLAENEQTDCCYMIYKGHNHGSIVHAAKEDVFEWLHRT